MMVADTDVLIDFLDGRAPAAERMALELDRGQLRMTVISRFELLAGAKSARQQAVVGALLGALPCLPLDEPGADHAAEIRQSLERDGVPIRMADSLIAGIVLAHRGMLLTRNRQHFERVPGLVLGHIGGAGRGGALGAADAMEVGPDLREGVLGSRLHRRAHERLRSGQVPR
jgi:tRNA(fMet)-specific endonuclease VapC